MGKCWSRCILGLVFLMVGLFGFYQLSFAPDDRSLFSEIGTTLSEANQQFTYQGMPIHPLLVKEFETWFSDNCPPITVSVDIGAASKARNEYSSKVNVRDAWVQSEIEGSEGYYGYQWLGTVKEDIHVLKTADCEGGSGVFNKLFFVKFSTDRAYDENGKLFERLLMTIVREFPLGDRDDAALKIMNDKIIVAASKYRNEAVTLTF